MKIDSIIWDHIRVTSSFKMWSWDDCSLKYLEKDGTAWIQRIENGVNTSDNLLVGITKILELTPWSFKAEGTVSNGKTLIPATIEASF